MKSNNLWITNLRYNCLRLGIIPASIGGINEVVFAGRKTISTIENLPIICGKCVVALSNNREPFIFDASYRRWKYVAMYQISSASSRHYHWTHTELVGQEYFFRALDLSHLWTTSALRLLAHRELIFILYLYSGLRPSERGKITSENGNLRNLRDTKIWQYRIRNQRPRLPQQNRWNTASGTILKFVYLLVVSNNKYLSYVVDSIIFGISVPDYPSRTVESTFLEQFWN